MKLYKIIGLLISVFLMNLLFFKHSAAAEVLTKQISGYKANVRVVNGDNDDSGLGSKERWAYTGKYGDQETRKTDDRTSGTIVSPRGWVYKGGTTTETTLPPSITYTDKDGYSGTLHLDKNTAPYYGWDRHKVQGYNGLDSSGNTIVYTFTKEHPVPGKTDEYYNGSTLEDIGVYSGTVTKTIPDPPPPTTSKPVAYINAPTNVHVGDTINVLGSGLDPKGLAITEYLWTTNNGQSLTNTGGSITVTNPVTLTLKVKNSLEIWSDITTHTISTNNEPPKVTIMVPPIVYAGDDVYVSSSANDEDGDTLSYSWNKPSGTNGNLEGQSGIVYFMDLGVKQFGLTVTDPSGESAAAIAETNVIAPTPTINIIQTGTLKENRKVIIDTSSSNGGSKRATITSIKYNITAMIGTSMNDVRIQSHTEGSTNGTILYDPSKGINTSLDNLSTFDMTFKKSGQYKIVCTITNNYGKTSTNSITLTIVVDAPPKAGFYTPEEFYRIYFDPNKFNGRAYGIIPFTDTETGTTGCYSTDGDTIEKRAWFFSFDSNNNDVIDDIFYPYNAATNKWDYSVKYTYDQAKNFDLDKFPVGNLLNITLETAHVGIYFSGMICKEAFGQDYIPQFVTTSDRKIGTMFD